MGEEDAPTPAFAEGQVAGSEINAGNGRRYTFEGHYLGDGTITYRASVEDVDGEFRGAVSGTFARLPGDPPPAGQVELMVRAAIRGAVGFRP